MALISDDKLEILDLSSRYNRALDNRLVDVWLDTWVAEGVLETPFGVFRGQEQLQNFMNSLLETARGKRHWTANYLIEGFRDSATMSCDLMIIQTQDHPGIFATGVYVDTLVKTSGVWKFSERKLAFDSMLWQAVKHIA